MALRRRGLTLDAIAKELGYADRSGARKAIERGLAQWMHQGVEQFRAGELESTDTLLDRLWPLVDCDAPDLKAIDRFLRVMEYRARIMGLYAKRESPPDTYPGAPDRAAEEKVETVNSFIEIVKKVTGGEFNAGFGFGPGLDHADDDDDDTTRHAQRDDLSADDEFADNEPATQEELDDDLPDGVELDDVKWVDGRAFVERIVDGMPAMEPIKLRDHEAARADPVTPEPQDPRPRELRADALRI